MIMMMIIIIIIICLRNISINTLHKVDDDDDDDNDNNNKNNTWAGHVARWGERRGVYRVLVGRPEGKRPLGRPRRRWEDNIKMDIHEVRCGDMDWIDLVQD